MYSQGYSQFNKEPVPDSTVKSNPPQWRAGYRAAEKASEARNKIAIKPTKVDRVNYGSLTITWSLITFITSTPRFHIFDRQPKLYPILAEIRKSIYDDRDKINGIKELVKCADKKFDSILQWGYDEGILTISDCELRGYTPK
ncbi:hypothetical protein NVP2275O_262 [Vibrio phage 2.275.O._10N.286.54.E11]|nr:hypothetical protein NVP2275O_262 [Vibrio phage 2.275.O._10N.286.54.E11]